MDRPQLDLSLPPFKVIRRNGSVVDFNPGRRHEQGFPRGRGGPRRVLDARA
jgi:hypothetical protein